MAGIRLVEESMQRQTPHTLNALQKLVMAMAAVSKNAGKKTLFGRDKGQEAYSHFLQVLRATVHAMVLDGLVQEATPSTEVCDTMLTNIKTFALAFPNWQDAYGFAGYFFGEQRLNASAAIERLR